MKKTSNLKDQNSDGSTLSEEDRNELKRILSTAGIILLILAYLTLVFIIIRPLLILFEII